MQEKIDAQTAYWEEEEKKKFKNWTKDGLEFLIKTLSKERDTSEDNKKKFKVILETAKTALKIKECQVDNQKFLELTMMFFFIILPLAIAIISSVPLIRYICSIYKEKKSNKDINNEID